MTPIMTVPSNLSAAAAEHHQQMLAQAQAYAQAHLPTQRPQRPAAVQPRIFLQDPPAGHPHKTNGSNGGSNGVHATTTAEEEEPLDTSAESSVVVDDSTDEAIKKS